MNQNDNKMIEDAGLISSHINNAYECLKSNLQRAKYLLFLHTGVEEDEGQTIENFEFLEKIMEIREEIDTSSSSDRLTEIKVSTEKD